MGAIMEWLCKVFGFGCAPPAPPAPPPVSGMIDMLDYLPFRARVTPMRSAEPIIYSTPDADHLFVDWPTGEADGNRGREEWSKDKDYIYLDAYSGTKNGQRYPVFSYRTEINGVVVPNPTSGQIYVPTKISATEATTVTVWGYIVANDGSFGKLWAWRATFTPTKGVMTPCGGVKRDTVLQQEVWWDSDNGDKWQWAGDDATPPFDANGTPIPFTTAIGRSNYMAFDVGTAWIVYDKGTMLACVEERP